MTIDNEEERLASTKGTTNFTQSNTTAGDIFKMSGVTANIRQSIQALISDNIKVNVSIPSHNHSISQSTMDPSWMTSVKKHSKKFNGHQLSIHTSNSEAGLTSQISNNGIKMHPYYAKNTSENISL